MEVAAGDACCIEHVGGSGLRSSTVEGRFWRDDDVAARIREATAGKGVDRIVDVNLVANLELDLACLANGGAISSYAMRDATDECSIPLLRAMIAGAVFRFVYIYTVRPSDKQAAIVEITASLEAEANKPMIGLIVPLHRTAEAHIALEQGSGRSASCGAAAKAASSTTLRTHKSRHLMEAGGRGRQVAACGLCGDGFRKSRPYS